MVREAILQKIEERGISQAKLCDDLGLTRQNFSSFLTGRRSLPFKKVIDVFQYLNLTVGEASKTVGHSEALEMSRIISQRLASKGMTLKHLSEVSQIHQSTISCFVNGKRNLCVSNLEKMLESLNMGVMAYEPRRR